MNKSCFQASFWYEFKQISVEELKKHGEHKYQTEVICSGSRQLKYFLARSFDTTYDDMAC